MFLKISIPCLFNLFFSIELSQYNVSNYGFSRFIKFDLNLFFFFNIFGSRVNNYNFGYIFLKLYFFNIFYRMKKIIDLQYNAHLLYSKSCSESPTYTKNVNPAHFSIPFYISFIIYKRIYL